MTNKWGVKGKEGATDLYREEEDKKKRESGSRV